MRRAKGNHECGQKHSNVDVVGFKGVIRRAVAESGEKMDALKAGLGDRDRRLLAEEDNQGLETAYHRSQRL
jgi:hypothetical protein